VRRIEPTFPDLLPLSHRLGGIPLREGAMALDPVAMRLVRQPATLASAGDTYIPRRPQRVLVHAGVVRSRQRAVARLLQEGCGLLVILDEPLAAEELPEPLDPQQVAVLNVFVFPLWGQLPCLPLQAFREKGFAVGTLVALAPQLPFRQSVSQAIETAVASGAQFVVLAPLLLSGEEKHAAYEQAFDPEGNDEFEDVLFHTEPADVARKLEALGSALVRQAGLQEGLLGPGTSLCAASCFAAACSLLLWARRLDLLDGVSSQGWRLRRAAQALLASGRDPFALMEEDNLRLVPGFDAWVEALARTLWTQEGEPFASLWLRWLEQADGT
jgi:hypothetical protein